MPSTPIAVEHPALERMLRRVSLMGVTRSREHKTTTRLNPTVRMETTPRHPQTKPINTLQQLERIRKNNRILRTHHHAPQPPRILTQTVRESGYSIERTPQRHFHTMLICEHHAVPLMLPSMLQILPILVAKSAASVTGLDDSYLEQRIHQFP